MASPQESFRELYRLGELDDRKVTVDIPGSRTSVPNLDGPGGQALQEMISRLDRRALQPSWLKFLDRVSACMHACMHQCLAVGCAVAAYKDMLEYV